MIVTTTFRHGIEDSTLRSRVQKECVSIARYMPQITRIQVIFGKETHHRKSEHLVTCHMVLSLSGKNPVNIYERCRSPGMAFDKARERAVSSLSRIHAFETTQRSRSGANAS